MKKLDDILGPGISGNLGLANTSINSSENLEAALLIVGQTIERTGNKIAATLASPEISAGEIARYTALRSNGLRDDILARQVTRAILENSREFSFKEDKSVGMNEQLLATALEVRKAISKFRRETELRSGAENTAGLQVQARRIEEGMREGNFTFGGSENGIQRRISPNYFPLPASLLPIINRIPTALTKLYVAERKLLEEARKNPGLPWARYVLFGLPEKLDLEAVPNTLPFLIRSDFVLSPDGDLKVCEFETSYGGVGECLGTRTVFNKVKPIPEEEVQFPGILEGYKRKCTALAQQGSIALFAPQAEGNGYTWETAYLVQRLQQEGSKNAFLGTMEEIDLRDTTAWYQGQRVGTLFNCFAPKNGLQFSKKEEKLMALWQKGRLELSPAPQFFYDNKIWLALLWEESLQSFWTSALGEDFPLLRSLIPKSSIVNRGSLASIPAPSVKQHFLKKALGAKGMQDVYDLGDQDEEGRTNLLERAIQEDETNKGIWLLQERIPSVERLVDYKSPGRNQSSLRQSWMQARVELYSFLGQEGNPLQATNGDMLVTLKEGTVVSGCPTSVMIPTRIVTS